jgi:hypothetical protein
LAIKGCKACNTERCPKYDLVQSLEKDKNRILRGTEKTKKYYRKIVKSLLIACAILIFELIVTLANGKDGVMIGFKFIKDLFIK